MTHANPLRDLQRIDLRRDDHQKTLSKVQAALKSDGGVAETRRKAEKADEALERLEAELRSITLEREAAKDHVAREEKQLYGGKVRVAKELQNLELEIQSLRRQLSNLDDVVLELMIKRDEAADGASAARDDLEKTEAKVSGQLDVLAKRQVALVAEMTKLDSEREALTATVPPGDLQLYDSLRKKKGGVAVADLVDHNCSACGIQLPRQDESRAMAGDRVRCDGCGRIVLG